MSWYIIVTSSKRHDVLSQSFGTSGLPWYGQRWGYDPVMAHIGQHLTLFTLNCYSILQIFSICSFFCSLRIFFCAVHRWSDLMEGYKAIELNEEQMKEERSLWAQCQAVADMKFTYVVSCQQYGIHKRSGNHRAQDILRLMTTYVTVFYYDSLYAFYGLQKVYTWTCGTLDVCAIFYLIILST